MTKSELRNLYKSKRKELSVDDVDFLSYKILDRLKELNIWNKDTYHIFLPIEEQNEVNTYPILNELFDLRKNVVLPKVSGDDMINCQIESGFQIEFMKFNIPEPIDFWEIDSKEIDVVFVPLIICDKEGHRVGYGKGYYDKWLKTCREDILKIGINFFEPVSEISNKNEFDVPLDYCVTPDETVSFIG